MASHPLEMSDCVTDGVHSHVTHVQASRWVRKHGEDIKLRPAGTLGEDDRQSNAAVRKPDSNPVSLQL